MDKFKRKHPGFRVYEKSVSRTADGGTVLLAEKDFPLFIEILECGIRNFEKHAASYEISVKPELIDMKGMEDAGVEALFADNNIRQVIHISYGTILSERDTAGKFIYRNRFFEVLNNHEELYYGFLEKHLGKHLELLR